MTRLIDMQITYGDVREGDLIVDPEWPRFFGYEVEKVSTHITPWRTTVSLRLAHSAALAASDGTSILVLREESR